MELSRVEYPAIVNSVPPSPAVKLVRDRLQKAQVLNTEIADWLQERRRAEEGYALALAKLCKRPLPGDNSELGIFSGPWHRVVESTSALSGTHNLFAQKIADEVEKPIRDFAARNSDWTSMKSLETNLSAIAKTVDSAEERAEKLRKRGQKAKPQQVAETATSVSNAHAEWDSQAPFVFEKLEVADEARCNNLRDALTRLQTLELDQAQSTMQAAEATLSIMLDITASDETKGFANKATLGRHKIERQQSRTGSRNPGHPSTPSIVTDDSVSVQSSHSGGGVSGGGHGLGLKRLGTVLRNRNRNSMFHRSMSPERRVGDRGLRGQPMSPNAASAHQNGNTLAVPSAASTLDIPSSEARAEPNGDRPKTAPSSSSSPPVVTVSEPQTDAEGYTIPAPNHDSAFQAQGEIEETQPQFKVEIKNDVIHEEEEEADAALSKVANTLRAQNTVSRKTRGRRDARDVRNTMFFPTTPDLSDHAHAPGSPPLTPMKISPRPSNVASEAGSDTQSIRSSRSIMSLATTTVRHPDLAGPGLQVSLIEIVNASFENGLPVKTLISGEIALAYHEDDDSDSPSSLNIRLDNFAVLEKVAPNPASVSAVVDRAGEYTVSPASIRRTSVAFKYQVHLEESIMSIYCPIIVTALWKLEPHQCSVIVNWKHNPDFKRLSEAATPYLLRNLVFVTGVEGAHATSCQSKPNGTFSRDRGKIAWKLGDTTIDPSQNTGGKLLGRFATDTLGRPGAVDVRWEISGEQADGVGSGLTISMQTDRSKVPEAEEADPFADASADATSPDTNELLPEWVPVAASKRVVSGKYSAA